MAKAAMKAAPKKAAPKPVATGLVVASQPYKQTAAQKKEEAKYRAQDDLRTLQRAAEVKTDPARVKMAQAEAQNQVKALSSVLKK